jgi:hypothetical protein
MAACNENVSDSQVETAVFIALETSKASEIEQATPEFQFLGLEKEIEDLREQVEDSSIIITEQAAQIAEYQTLLETLQAVPTELPYVPTPTRTPVFSLDEVEPTPIIYKQVVADGNAPLYYSEDENAKGYPVMIKTNPVIRFEDGDVIRVFIDVILADGGGEFYEVVGPAWAGYFIRVGDVDDYE